MSRPMSDEDALIAGLHVRFEATGDPEQYFYAYCVGSLSVQAVHASRDGTFMQQDALGRIRELIAIGRATERVEVPTLPAIAAE